MKKDKRRADQTAEQASKDRNWKAAASCKLLTEMIGHVTKVTIRYEVKEPTTTEMVTERTKF